MEFKNIISFKVKWKRDLIAALCLKNDVHILMICYVSEEMLLLGLQFDINLYTGSAKG